MLAGTEIRETEILAGTEIRETDTGRRLRYWSEPRSGRQMLAWTNSPGGRVGEGGEAVGTYSTGNTRPISALTNAAMRAGLNL